MTGYRYTRPNFDLVSDAVGDAETTPRRASGKYAGRFQAAAGKRSAVDQLTERQQFLVDLETVAVELTRIGQGNLAEKLRDIARRNA